LLIFATCCLWAAAVLIRCTCRCRMQCLSIPTKYKEYYRWRHRYWRASVKLIAVTTAVDASIRSSIRLTLALCPNRRKKDHHRLYDKIYSINIVVIWGDRANTAFMRGITFALLPNSISHPHLHGTHDIHNPPPEKPRKVTRTRYIVANLFYLCSAGWYTSGSVWNFLHMTPCPMEIYPLINKMYGIDKIIEIRVAGDLPFNFKCSCWSIFNFIVYNNGYLHIISFALVVQLTKAQVQFYSYIISDLKVIKCTRNLHSITII